MPSEEMILVIKREVFDAAGSFHGLNFNVDRYLPLILSRQNNFFMARSEAEPNPKFKQIIPYAILVHGNKVLHYVRGKKAGEQRLVAKGSIGIGGHMNDQDEGLFALDREAYLAGVQREVNEELEVGTTFANQIVALLNDDTNEVGQVHLGVVHILRLAGPEVKKREAMITNLEFLSPDELRARRDTLESWSQICVDHLEALIKAAA